MSRIRHACLAVLWLCGAAALAQQERREPHISYLYPAGGRRGTVVQVTVGGQSLRSITRAHFTGAGVHAKVLATYPPVINIQPEQREALVRKLRVLIAQRWDELRAAGRVGPRPPWRELLLPGGNRPRRANGEESATSAPAALPEHPLLYDLDKKSLRELLHIRHAMVNLRKGQFNAQLAESVLLEVTIDRDAALGDRELRLRGRQGLTNPMVFEVGAAPETIELESNDPGATAILPPEPPLTLPVVLNGQVMPGDVDRFRFHAQAGQQLVIATSARRLIPYLADAVPGWFQATVALYDSEGHEVAFADDYRFDPDPVLCYEIAADGEYEVEIRDALYRGRADFVYRISVGAHPFITSMFPLGTRVGHKRYVAIDGWNLTTDRLYLDPQPDAEGPQHKHWGTGRRASNRLTYAVDQLAASPEAETNDTPTEAQLVTLPRILDGRIAPPGDVDVFRFKGRAGDEVVAEVQARRLNSPLDSLLRLTDATGRVLAWNDDHEQVDGVLYMDAGLLTHSADSYLRFKLLADGEYFVQLTDSQGQGGPAYGYRLRVGPPSPDFALRVTPASINVPAGGTVPICVYALRKDGFNGDIEITLRGAPRGFQLSGARVPAGRDRVRMTLTAPAKPSDELIVLHLEGRAVINETEVRHPAVPAEDMMQAFLYRHLTPAEQLVVAVLGNRFPAGTIAGDATPVRIPVGGTASVEVRLPARASQRIVKLELNTPPAGITLESTTPQPDGVTLVLGAKADAVRPGFADNLIVEAFVEVPRPRRNTKAGAEKSRISGGFLPAIPIELVAP